METAAKYVVVVAAGAGLVWYYTSTDKKGQKPVAVQDVKKESKKAARKVQSVADKAVKSVASVGAAASTDTQDTTALSGASNKRKANTQVAIQTHAAPTAERDDDDEAIDESTRQFAERMRQARQGVNVNKTDRGEARVKTVKAKGSQISSPGLLSGSSRAEDDHWAPAASSSTLKSSGIDDMLEKAAPGPSSLRITAPTQPTKEKVNRPKKEEVVETKKQRQNRKKREERQAADAESRAVQRKLEEQQRRTARIARNEPAKNEPAKNGVAAAPTPLDNPWGESNAHAETQVLASSNQGQLLDTFDVESNSSSNAGEVNSTAATSTTDQAPSSTMIEDGDFQKIIEESNIEDGWTDVKTSKKSRKQQGNGDVTPTQAAGISNQSKKQSKVNGRSSGFGALQDEPAE